MCYWKLNPKRKTQINNDRQEETLPVGETLSPNPMGEKTSNQIVFHPTNSLCVEASYSGPKDKQLEMNREELEILKHVNGSKNRKHHQKPIISINFRRPLARKVDFTTTRMSVEAKDFWPKDKSVEGNLKERDILKKVLLNTFESHLSCSICSEVLIKPVKLPCMHRFCKTCIFQREWNQKDCPICRAKYETVSLEDTLLVGCIEELIGSTYTNNEKKKKEMNLSNHALTSKSNFFRQHMKIHRYMT
ncbi:hypothetical protein QYM36_002494 [Artemia franciscana]|uniref:RING-type domain-containing protein n=1 Tax=Artemia franciscana TaxID=6661 RepID=A0AA88I153_ARTSF|nr:hypothetical protein QYM36_002494 [Artemia franciscana]